MCIVYLMHYVHRFRDGTYVRTQSKTGRIEFARTKLEHAGKYQCKMTNPQNGSVMSDVVTLTVGETLLTPTGYPPILETIVCYDRTIHYFCHYRMHACRGVLYNILELPSQIFTLF